MKNLFLLFAAFGLMLAISSCDKCKKVVCENNGTCEEGICTCPEGFSGQYCTIEDVCVTQDPECDHGECEESEDGEAVCDCDPYYFEDKCTAHCVNGTYSADNGSCNCEQGYEGESCETLSNIKFYGTYNYDHSFSSSNNTVISIISNYGDEQYPERVKMTNLTSYGDNKGYAEISGDSIWFPNQTLKGQGGIIHKVETLQEGVLENEPPVQTFTIMVQVKLIDPNIETNWIPQTWVFVQTQASEG